MDPAFRNRRFFQHFDPARWEDELCAELAPVLRLALAEPGQHIASMGLENVKMPDLVVLLTNPPSPATYAAVEARCADQPKLRAQPGSIVCFDHYHSIDWGLPATHAAPPPEKPSLWRRLFS